MQDLADSNPKNCLLQRVASFFCRPDIPSLILLFSLLVVVVLHIPLAEFPLGPDQSLWATAGMDIGDGAVFCKDFLHFHLPGLGFSYALAFCFVDDPRVATMLVSLAGSLLMLTGMYLLLQLTFSSAAAAWSVLLFSVWWPTSVGFWEIAQKDFMAMWGVLLGTWLMARSMPEARLRYLSIFLSGFLVGLAVMFKPLFLISGIMLTAIQIASFIFSGNVIYRKTRQQWFAFSFELLLPVIGALTIAVAYICYLAVGNALEDFYHGLFVFAPVYADFNMPFSRMVNLLHRASYAVGMRYGLTHDLYFWVWTTIMIAGFFGLVKKNSGKARYWLAVPILTALFTYFIQQKGFLYHAVPWQICLVMVAGIGFSAINAEIDILRSCRKAFFIFAIVSGVGLLWGRAIINSRYVNGEVSVFFKNISREAYLDRFYKNKHGTFPQTFEILAQWVSENSSFDDKILVWGNQCQLYALTGRKHATHSPFNLMLTCNVSGNEVAVAWQNKIRAQFMRQLASEKPKFIIIINNDETWLTPESSEAIAYIPGFKTFIDSQYQKVKSIELFDVYQFNS